MAASGSKIPITKAEFLLNHKVGESMPFSIVYPFMNYSHTQIQNLGSIPRSNDETEPCVKRVCVCICVCVHASGFFPLTATHREKHTYTRVTSRFVNV